MHNTLHAKVKIFGNPAWYPVVGSKIRTFSFDGNSTKFEKHDMFVGQIPDCIIVGLLDSRAFKEDLENYLFALTKFGLIQIRQVDDSEAYPYEVLEMNGTDNLKGLREYDRFLEPAAPGYSTDQAC